MMASSPGCAGIFSCQLLDRRSYGGAMLRLHPDARRRFKHQVPHCGTGAHLALHAVLPHWLPRTGLRVPHAACPPADMCPCQSAQTACCAARKWISLEMPVVPPWEASDAGHLTGSSAGLTGCPNRTRLPSLDPMPKSSALVDPEPRYQLHAPQPS